MPECIFCRIARGAQACTKVYEDDSVLAFMDFKPITKGHILIISKKHAELLTELDDNQAADMIVVAKKVGLALKKSKLNCHAINYILSDGAEAGQNIFHAHMHVIPRYRGDGFGLRMPERDEEEEDEKRLERTAIKIRKFMERRADS
ncbi:HIT domain-containing protein [Candidatus Micrarchaeota archaeon]|nr:HIT domain-containing protein [Candidatus Micrarchaeota archaeon]